MQSENITSISATDHKWDGDWKDQTNGASKKPTCTEAGFKTQYRACQNDDCSQIQTREVSIPTIDHTWSEEEYLAKGKSQAATCTEDGWNAYFHTCTVCEAESEIEKKTISATGHSWDHKETDEWDLIEYTPATCLDPGLMREGRTCTVCQEKEERETVLPVSDNHTWGNGVVTKEPTTTEKGEMTYTCNVCTGTKTEEIDMLDPDPTPETPTPTNPTPTNPTPAAPAAPAVPAAPAPAAPAAVIPAPEEEVPEDETPLAPPEEDLDEGETPLAAPEATPAGENLDEGETPLAAPDKGSWAVLNLVLALLTALASVLLLISGMRKNHSSLHFVSLVPALGALVAFILTEDMRLSMAVTDRWTLLMVLIALVQLTVCVLAGRKQSGSNNNPGGPTPARA